MVSRIRYALNWLIFSEIRVRGKWYTQSWRLYTAENHKDATREAQSFNPRPAAHIRVPPQYVSRRNPDVTGFLQMEIHRDPYIELQQTRDPTHWIELKMRFTGWIVRREV